MAKTTQLNKMWLIMSSLTMKVKDTIANQSSYYLSIIMYMLSTYVSLDNCLGLMDLQMIHKLRLIVYENIRS